MQKRYIPFAAVLLAAAAANAQTPVFHEGFDAEQTKASTEMAYYEFINSLKNSTEEDSRSIDDSDPYAGEGALKFNNVSPDGEEDVAQHDQFWYRAVKFRNLPLQEGKSYRLTWRFKGSNMWNDGTTDKKSRMFVSLMQGGENADISLLDANGNEFRYEVSYFNEDNYETYTRMFYFASEQLQKDTYAKNHPDKDPLADTFFATFNVVNPGEYMLDEVDLVESPIAGVAFEFNTIRVDFGFGTNVKDLASASPLGRVLLPLDCAKVSVNGTEVAVEAVELHKDGYMYIYTEEDIDDDAEVKVSFTNPADEAQQVKYKGNLAPEGAVPDFTGEAGSYDDRSGISDNVSFDYLEPSFLKVVPEDGSFGLSEDLNEVSFTFDRKVKTADIVCMLNDDEKLVVKNAEDAAETVVFQRAGGKAFDKGLNDVLLSNVISEKGTESSKTFTASFEVGKVQVASESYDLVSGYNFNEAAANTIPEGWTVNNEGEIRESGSAQGGGPRTFEFGAGGTVNKALYLRCALDDDGVSKGGYAEMNDFVELPAGDLRVQFQGFCWKGSGLNVKGEIINEAGEVVAEQEGIWDTNVNGDASKPANCDKFNVAFNNEKAGKYKFRLTLLPTSTGWIEVMFGGVNVYKYTKTEGASTESEVTYEDKGFGGANDNCAPPAGSGWNMYYNGEIREPGADFNYNGSRIFKLGIGDLSCGYYNGVGVAWPNSYVEFGGSEESSDPRLHLEEGRYQITYYASNWKEKGANAGVDHIVYFELDNAVTGDVIVERDDKITECDMNGDRNASISAKKIQFTIKITEEDDYKIKLGCTTEQFVGNIKIEKLGSQTAYYLGLVNTAREAAEAELQNAADELYDGTTKTALAAAIEKYKDATVLHSPAEVNAAKAELEELTSKMKKRCEYAGRFSSAVDNAGTLLSEVEGTKFAKLNAYTQLSNVWAANLGVEIQTLEDDNLVEAVSTLENNVTYLNNMKADDKGVALLTKQVVALANLLGENDPFQAESETVIAAGEALTDDQELAKILKLQVTKALYERIAAGENPFELTDDDPEPEDGEDYKTLDFTSFIQNSDLYVTEKGSKTLTDHANVPGWNIEDINGKFSVEWGWVGYTCSEFNPVVNQFLLNGWNGEQDVNQTVAELPAGKYYFGVGTQDRGFQDTSDAKMQAMETKQHWTVTGNIDGEDGKEGEILSYIWWQTPGMAEKGIKPFSIANQGQWYGLTETKTDAFVVNPTDGVTGEATIGAHPISYQSSASVDNFRLYMIGKADGFDYAGAVKTLENQIKDAMTGIEEAPEGEPIDVAYYNAAGIKVATPAGVTIKIATYANGFVKVTKFIAK